MYLTVHLQYFHYRCLNKSPLNFKEVINRTQITDQKSPSNTSYLQLFSFANGLVFSITEELSGSASEC